jgi:hypothetical protein
VSRIAVPPPKAAFTTERVFIYYPSFAAQFFYAAVPFGIIARFRRNRLQLLRAIGANGRRP